VSWYRNVQRCRKSRWRTGKVVKCPVTATIVCVFVKRSESHTTMSNRGPTTDCQNFTMSSLGCTTATTRAIVMLLEHATDHKNVVKNPKFNYDITGGPMEQKSLQSLPINQSIKLDGDKCQCLQSALFNHQFIFSRLLFNCSASMPLHIGLPPQRSPLSVVEDGTFYHFTSWISFLISRQQGQRTKRLKKLIQVALLSQIGRTMLCVCQ